MSLTLAFDTTAEACSVALTEADEVVSESRELCSHGHATVLVPMIEQVLAEAGVKPASVDTIGVTVGPGSFTGIRTGIAAARGLALGTGASPVGISSLWAVSWRALEDAGAPSTVLCILDTRRADYFVQQFRSDGTPLTEPIIADLQLLRQQVQRARCILAGNAVSRLLSNCPELEADVQRSPGDGLPRAEDVARLARRQRRQPTAVGHSLTPLYLRRAATTRPGQKTRT